MFGLGAFRAEADSADDAWLDPLVPGAAQIRREAWGPVTERRMLLPSGLIVESGITTALWAAVPLDAGTARVLRDGARVIHDPRDFGTTALDAISGAGNQTRAAIETRRHLARRPRTVTAP